MARIVLCVDDDPDDRELIRNAIFSVDPSYTVTHATNGKEDAQRFAGYSYRQDRCKGVVVQYACGR